MQHKSFLIIDKAKQISGKLPRCLHLEQLENFPKMAFAQFWSKAN
jgi:hypothetical protein